MTRSYNRDLRVIALTTNYVLTIVQTLFKTLKLSLLSTDCGWVGVHLEGKMPGLIFWSNWIVDSSSSSSSIAQSKQCAQWGGAISEGVYFFIHFCLYHKYLNTCFTSIAENFEKHLFTTIPYIASTGPEQGFPCVVFPHREKLVFNTGFPGDENRFFPVRNTTTLFSLQGWVCSEQKEKYHTVHAPK